MKTGTRSPWQVQLTDLLSSPDAPRVITPAILDRMASSLPQSPSRMSVYRWIRDSVADGSLGRAGRGVYLNNLADPKPEPDEAVTVLSPKATVSLQRVLSKTGVYKGDGSVITAVVPLERNAPPPKVGVFEYGIGTVWLFAIPERVLFACDRALRLQEGVSYPIATPEKALSDWLYLGASTKSRLDLPNVADLDLSAINQDKMRIIASRMGVGNVWLSLFRESRELHGTQRQPSLGLEDEDTDSGPGASML